jgi:hypothetical protein
MNALYHGRDLKRLPSARDDELLMTALASFVVGAGFAVVLLMMLAMQ